MAFAEYFNAKELVDFAEAKFSENVNQLWNQLFPAKSIPSMDISWIKAKNSRLAPLRAAALGEKAARRSPSGFQRVESDLPFFRESMPVDEKQRQNITNLLIVYQNNPDMVDEILRNLYHEHAQLIWGAFANCDLMVGSLLTSGKIIFSSDVNDGRTNNYEYDYDQNGQWRSNNILQLNAGQYWNDACKATNDPLDDIVSAIEDQKQLGWTTAKILLNTSTFRGLCKSQSITKAIAPLGGVVKRSQIKELIEDETKCSLIVYDNYVLTGDGNSTNVLPDGKVVLLPDGELGKMCFAPTPEAFNLQLGKTEPRKDIAVMRNGVTVLSKAEDNPVDYETIVSATMLPSYPKMDAVYVLSVLAAG
jgi:hypothetical protein